MVVSWEDVVEVSRRSLMSQCAEKLLVRCKNHQKLSIRRTRNARNSSMSFVGVTAAPPLSTSKPPSAWLYRDDNAARSSAWRSSVTASATAFFAQSTISSATSSFSSTPPRSAPPRSLSLDVKDAEGVRLILRGSCCTPLCDISDICDRGVAGHAGHEAESE